MPMPKLGLFRPVNWTSPSSREQAMGLGLDLGRGWDNQERDRERDRNRDRDRNRRRRNMASHSRTGDDDTEEEQPFDAQQCSFTQHRSPKRRKISREGRQYRTGSTEMVMKQEPTGNASTSPRTTFGHIPTYIYPPKTNYGGPGYTSSGEENNAGPSSSRSVSPRTKLPTPSRLLFPTPHPSQTFTNQTGTDGTEMTNTQPSLRALSKELKRRNQEMASLSRGLWYSAREQQQQQQYSESGSSEERRRRQEEWAAISLSGSSEEGEVSSFHGTESNKDIYDNGHSYDSNGNDSSGSYSCGQERSPDDNPQTLHQSSPFLAYRDPNQNEGWNARFETTSESSAPFEGHGSGSSARYYSPGLEPPLTAEQREEQRTMELYGQAIQMVKDTCLEATKWYLRAHCVNQQARGGGGAPGTSVPSHKAGEDRKDRKRRRKRKLRNRNGSSSSTSSSPSPGPSPLSRRRKGKQPARKRKRTTAHSSSSSSSSQLPEESQVTDSLLTNISQICTLFWSRSQSLRLHDTSSIELSTARNMYWLLDWAETVAFAVPPSVCYYPSSSVVSNNTSIDSDLPGWGDSSIEGLEASRRWEWRRPRAASSHRKERGERYRDDSWDEVGFMWRHRPEGGGIEIRKSENGAYWRGEQEVETKQVLEAGEAVCEALGWGEGVERINRVKEYCGLRV
ncbi:hypothetical protein B0T20DRAFT_487551 [Sordaria brevicollis]|uniref:Uncharacterized protein n=1 Tax=Sordaria brevicollis TaxID=83679 RepID=A0AAE0P9P9_SORBR|nr:hypothetical protein B0T20DRAFT_487551 [Sordaria brevicollis]